MISTKPEVKFKIAIGLWRCEVHGPPSKRKRHRPRKWRGWLVLLILVMILLLVWLADQRAFLFLLAAFYLLGNLLDKLPH